VHRTTGVNHRLPLRPVQSGIVPARVVERRDDVAPLSVRSLVGKDRPGVVAVAPLHDRVRVCRFEVVRIVDSCRAVTVRNLLRCSARPGRRHSQTKSNETDEADNTAERVHRGEAYARGDSAPNGQLWGANRRVSPFEEKGIERVFDLHTLLGSRLTCGISLSSILASSQGFPMNCGLTAD